MAWDSPDGPMLRDAFDHQAARSRQVRRLGRNQRRQADQLLLGLVEDGAIDQGEHCERVVGKRETSSTQAVGSFDGHAGWPEPASSSPRPRQQEKLAI